MAVGSFIHYNDSVGRIFDGTFDLDTDTFGCALLTSSYTPTATHASFSDLTNELSHASYTGGSNNGLAVGSPAVTQISGKQWKFSSANISNTFNTTDATFKYAVFFERNATPASAKLLGYIDLNTGGGSVTVTAGNTLTINTPANGWFTGTGAS